MVPRRNLFCIFLLLCSLPKSLCTKGDLEHEEATFAEELNGAYGRSLGESVLGVMFRECIERDSISCVGKKFIGFVNGILHQRNLRLSDSMELVKTTQDFSKWSRDKPYMMSKDGKPYFSRNMGSGAKSLKDLVINRFMDFLYARELRVKLPILESLPDVFNFKRSLKNGTLVINLRSFMNEARGSGGGFGGDKKGGGGGMMMMMMMMKGMMMAMGLAGAGAMAMKGISLGLMALILSAIAAAKSLGSKDDDHGGGHYVYHAGSGHGHRSLDSSWNAAAIAYRGHRKGEQAVNGTSEESTA